MNKPEGKKLSKEELDKLGESFRNGYWIPDETKQLFSHITAQDGEVEKAEERVGEFYRTLLQERDARIEHLEALHYHVSSQLKEKDAEIERLKNTGITHVFRGTPMDVDAVAEMLDKDKDKKIESLRKALDQVGISNAHWLRSFQKGQKETLKLQATIDQLRGAASGVIEDAKGMTQAYDDRHVGKELIEALKQACTEGEKKKVLTEKEKVMGELTASEAIFAFCAWLTTREKKTVMGSTANCAPVVELIKEFCATNHLTAPRDNYTDFFKMPE